MNSKIKIGFFDSGVGGISVMAHAKNRIKNAEYIYYADTLHVPYGSKTREQIISYSDAAVGYLVSQGVSAVVVACNTATSMSIEYLRSKYSIPIIGMEPAVKPAAERHPGKPVLVTATPVTIAGEKLHNLINRVYVNGIMPDLIGLPGLVTFAESENFDVDTVAEYLDSVIDKSKNYAAVVLGCTHFTYFRDSFRKLLGNNIDLIDGTDGTVRRLISLLNLETVDVCEDYDGIPTTYVRSGTLVEDEESLRFFKSLEKRALI